MRNASICRRMAPPRRREEGVSGVVGDLCMQRGPPYDADRARDMELTRAKG